MRVLRAFEILAKRRILKNDVLPIAAAIGADEGEVRFEFLLHRRVARCREARALKQI